MSGLISAANRPTGDGESNFDDPRIAEVKAWLVSQFETTGKDVPEIEYKPQSVAHLHALATVSRAKTKAAGIVAADLRQKATEYHSQARIREILENVGLAQESWSRNATVSGQVLANVAKLLNISDTEMSSFLVAMGDICLRKTEVEEKRAKIQEESKVVLEHTRKALARLTYLKRTFSQLDDEVASFEQILHWKTNLPIVVSKEQQFLQQYSLYKALLNRVGYTPEGSHGVLIEMAEHKKELEKNMKPILDTLRNYRDLPPDKALATLTIEDKKRQYAAAEKYLEDILESAFTSTE
ncbi:AUGMIN subunit 1-like isoform X2 [Tasmannia lanceolata]|uniref:AUGMIN subunit 1-like isoform X2 n=1 Tax=Tasmannia lanceolata TaxID=3420 RepID=UPI0040646BAB